MSAVDEIYGRLNTLRKGQRENLLYLIAALHPEAAFAALDYQERTSHPGAYQAEVRSQAWREAIERIRTALPDTL